MHSENESIKKGAAMCGLRNTNDGLCSFCNFVSFFNTIKAFSQSSSDVGLYYKQKTCICSRAAKPPFLLPKNCVKMRMIFFSCAGRHQLCYAYNCVTLMWHIDGEILHLFLFNILTKKVVFISVTNYEITHSEIRIIYLFQRSLF